MKNAVGLIFIAIVIFGIFSCSNRVSEEEYYNKANELMSKENWDEAETNFDQIIEKYPNGEYSAKALFMVAFINANYRQNLDKAREHYQEFLDKYPDHELADDAEYELKHLGRSIDELPFLKGEPMDTTGNEAAVPPSE